MEEVSEEAGAEDSAEDGGESSVEAGTCTHHPQLFNPHTQRRFRK